MRKIMRQQRITKEQLTAIEELYIPYDYVPASVCGRLEIVINEGIKSIREQAENVSQQEK